MKKKKINPLLRFFNLYKQEFLIILLSFCTILVFIPVFTYVYFARDLRSKDNIMNRNDTGVILTDRHNKPFFTFYQAKQRAFVPLASIPKIMQQTVISSEDKDFYSHPGFSIQAILRSLFLDIMNREAAYGGSTLTQQLVKNALLNANKSFLRKYQEIVLAQEIERRYSKNEILEMYLNSVYFGEGAFGIENAALSYFGKHASQLDLAESALLTGLLPSPSRYSPISGSEAEAKVRQRIVLQKMVETHVITPKQKTQAESEHLTYTSSKNDINSRAAHFALMIRDELVNKFGEERISRSGFRVKTTLDLSLQDYAELVVQQQVARLAKNQVSNGAAVVMDPKTGEILALVGSEDWYNNDFGKVNMAITPRSPGSSFKPIVYAAGLEERLISPATLLNDSPTVFPGGYRPLDYDRSFRGKVTVRRALSNSLNIPAVDLLSKVGLPRALEMASRLGITTLKDESQYGLSLVLGTGEVKLVELTGVYSVFADQGQKNDIADILEIDDKSGQKVYTYQPNPQQVLEPEVAFLISSILSDNRARAEEFGTALNISRTAAVKTGTAEDYKDALTVGYTPSVVVGVWVGNNDNRPMDQIAGSLGAAPIWRALMEKVLEGTPVEKFEIPSTILALPICRANGLLLHNLAATSSATLEYFIQGTQPTRYCDSGSLQIRPPSFMLSPTITSQSTVTPVAPPTNTPTAYPTLPLATPTHQ